LSRREKGKEGSLNFPPINMNSGEELIDEQSEESSIEMEAKKVTMESLPKLQP